MKSYAKTTIILFFLFIVLCLTSCGKKKENNVKLSDIPHYSQIIAVESKNEQEDIFKIESKGLYKIDAEKNLLGVVYSLKNSTYVYSTNISKGQNFNKNIMKILRDGRETEVNDFYAAIDFRLNSISDKIAFRAFSSDSIESAEGMKIYDIKNNKYIDLKSKVLVSGNLYSWLDGNRILYYGNIEGVKNSDKIYSYNFVTGKEEIYLDNLDGYCMYFIPVNNNILFLTKQDDQSTLYYYDSINKEIKKVGYDLNNIYNSVVDKKDGDVFFLGNEDGSSTALYKFSPEKLSIQRISYDFPKQVDETAGMAIDDQGNVYFCGNDNQDEKYNENVFMYGVKDGAINLISTHEGKYNICSDISN